MTNPDSQRQAGTEQSHFLEGSVRVAGMVCIPDLLREMGAEPAGVFERAGSNPTRYSDPDNRVTYAESGRLLGECVRSTDCEHFGLLVGQRYHLLQLGTTGTMIQASPTVREALLNFAKHIDLHDEGGVLELREEPEYAELNFSIHLVGIEALDQIYDLCAAVMTVFMRALCGRQWTPAEVYLPRKKPHSLRPYRQFFRSVVLFNSHVWAITFSNDVLEQKVSSADQVLLKSLEKEAGKLHKTHPWEMTDRVYSAMQQGLLTGRHSAGEVAAHLGMRERTFHRRLKNEGTTFRREMDRARLTTSLNLLKNSSLSVLEIAQAMGYCDSSTFIRAFRRWTGERPTDIRKRRGHSSSIDRSRSSAR